MRVASLKRNLRCARGEDGFTLIEVLVAAVILVLASMAVFGVLTAATRNAQRAQATQVAMDKAQEEIEKLHSIPYSELALSTTPQSSAKPLNPNYRVSGNSFYLQREPLGEPATMVVKGREIWGKPEQEIEGNVKPGPISFKEGNVSGKLYRYIVWRNDPTCPESATNLNEDFCPGPQDYKQIIVAAQLDTAGNESFEHNYVEVQSQVVNPETRAQRTTQGNEPGSGGTGAGGKQEEEEREKELKEDQTGLLSSGKAVTAQQFYLSDTPCAASGTTTREEISGDHLLHNTLGICANGLQTGQTAGAPDALLRAAPPDPAPEDESNPPLLDYSSDSYLEPPSGSDNGLQILHDDSAGCNFPPKSTVHPEAKIHRWVTDKMPQNFKLSGTVTLEFYSRTIAEASYPGTICAFLFKRNATEATDTRFENEENGRLYWTFSSQGSSSWPRTEWTRLRLTMKIGGSEAVREVKKDERLGLALSVEAASVSPAAGLQVMYDHPDYASRLEVDTTTPIEGG